MLSGLKTDIATKEPLISSSDSGGVGTWACFIEAT